MTHPCGRLTNVTVSPGGGARVPVLPIHIRARGSAPCARRHDDSRPVHPLACAARPRTRHTRVRARATPAASFLPPLLVYIMRASPLRARTCPDRRELRGTEHVRLPEPSHGRRVAALRSVRGIGGARGVP